MIHFDPGNHFKIMDSNLQSQNLETFYQNVIFFKILCIKY